MSFVAATTGNTDTGATLDLVVNVGSGVDRKAIVVVGVDDNTETASSTAAHDPAGANTAMTVVRNEEILLSGSSMFECDMFFLDLSDALSGNQTFRVSKSSGHIGLVAAVLIYDDMPAGAPEAHSASERATAALDISTNITTLTNGALVISGTMGFINAASPFFTPVTSGLTERVDADTQDWVGIAAGDLTVATAGVQAVEWDGAASYTVAIQILAAWPPNGGGGGASAAVSGTIADATDEDDIRAGGKTIIITLTGATWLPA